MNIPIQFIINGAIVHLITYTLPVRPKYSEISEFIQSLFPSNRGFNITIYYVDGSNESFDYIDDIEKTYLLKQPIRIDVLPGTIIHFKINWQGTLPNYLLLKLDKPTISQLMEFIDTECRSSRSINKNITSKQILHLKLKRGGKITVFKKYMSVEQEYQDGDEFEISYADPEGNVFIPSHQVSYPSNMSEFAVLGDTPASEHVQLEATQYADVEAADTIRAKLGVNIKSIPNEEDRAKFTRIVARLTVEECRKLAERLVVSSQTASDFLRRIYVELNDLPEEEILINIRELIKFMGGKRTKRKRKRTKRKRTKCVK